MASKTIYQKTLAGKAEIVQRPKKKKERKPRETVGKVLFLGGGLQSSLIAELVAIGELEAPDLIIFADTGAEPPWVYAQVQHIDQRLKDSSLGGVTIVNDGHIIEDLWASKRSASMPLFTRSPDGKTGQLRRQCTREYKIKPADDAILDWLVEQGHAKIDSIGRRRVNRSVQVETWFGFTTDEDYRKGKPNAWRMPRYPLIELGMSRDDCEQWYRDRDLPVPYKSSCFMCPYHSDAFWRDLKNNQPGIFEQACEFDDSLRTRESYYFNRTDGEVYLHRSCIPLRNVPFNQPSPQLRLFEDRDAWKTDSLFTPCGMSGGFSCAT